MQRRPLSLRAQAVAWLAQRDHSERELRRKLQHKASAGRGIDADGAADAAADADAQVDEVIAWLRDRAYLDDARFVASRVDLREGRFGLSRIQHELSQHGVDLPVDLMQRLRATELDRAQALWERRFGQVAADPREAARQARFLTGRGFSGEVVRQVLRAAGRCTPSD